MKRASALAALAWVLLFALAINVNVAHAFDVAALFAPFGEGRAATRPSRDDAITRDRDVDARVVARGPENASPATATEKNHADATPRASGSWSAPRTHAISLARGDAAATTVARSDASPDAIRIDTPRRSLQDGVATVPPPTAAAADADAGAAAAAAAAAACADLANGALKFSVTTWTSLPSEDLVRVGAVDAETSGGAAAAREMYVSLVVTRDDANAGDAVVSLRGVTVAFEFSRVVVTDESTGATETADLDRFVFMCWGAQKMPSPPEGPDGGHRPVPCDELVLDFDAVGPRVTFGDVELSKGEFLVGGYSNFLFSFKERTAMPMENSVTLLAPYCDVDVLDLPPSELPLLAPTFMLGWNPNKHLKLSACPSLLDMVFHSVIPAVDEDDTALTQASGVVGHRSCATMDVTGVTVPVPYAETVDPASFEVTCEGAQLAWPLESFRAGGAMKRPAAPLSCDDLDLVMTADGLRISFVDGSLGLCPGCFIVGGPDNVIASWRTISGSDASAFAIAPPAMPFCGAGPDLAVPATDGPITPCNSEEDTHLYGDVLNGGTFLTSSMGACCLACQENPSCNVWSFCTADDGCGQGTALYSYSQCVLKYQDPELLSPGPAPGDRGPDVGYTSGSLPDKDVDPFVPDTMVEVREEEGPTCATCQIEDAANYKGDPLNDGTELLVDSAEACCNVCHRFNGCNSFVYCAGEDGCYSDYYLYKHRECWLKWLAPDLYEQFPPPAWARGDDAMNWTSGLVNRTACAPGAEVPLPAPVASPPPAPLVTEAPAPAPAPAPAEPETCLESAARVPALCTGVFLGQEEDLSIEDAAECCEVIADMNTRRCFCDADVIDALEQLADPLVLVGGFVCGIPEDAFLAGVACASPAPVVVELPSSPPPPPPGLPPQPEAPAASPPPPGAPPTSVEPPPEPEAPPAPDALSPPPPRAPPEPVAASPPPSPAPPPPERPPTPVVAPSPAPPPPERPPTPVVAPSPAPPPPSPPPPQPAEPSPPPPGSPPRPDAPSPPPPGRPPAPDAPSPPPPGRPPAPDAPSPPPPGRPPAPDAPSPPPPGRPPAPDAPSPPPPSPPPPRPDAPSPPPPGLPPRPAAPSPPPPGQPPAPAAPSPPPPGQPLAPIRVVTPEPPCLQLLRRLMGECAPLLGEATSATMTQGCCDVIREMNSPELRCFCDADVLDELGPRIRPVSLMAPFLCGSEVELFVGEECVAPVPAPPSPITPPQPEVRSPPPPVAPPQPVAASPQPEVPSPPPPVAPPQPVAASPPPPGAPPRPAAPSSPPPEAPEAPAPPPPEAPEAPEAPAPPPPEAPVAPVVASPLPPAAPSPPPPGEPPAPVASPPSPPPPGQPPVPVPPNACPRIRLLGPGAGPGRNEVFVNSVWIDPGATATDDEDGNLTDAIVRDASELDTTTPGVYRVTYTVADADGCEAFAARYVRVVALVATSNAFYLRDLCVNQVSDVRQTCEVGMRTTSNETPNPSAFPACCLIVSEMDAAACFCDAAVVSKVNANNATFFNALAAFTPMACGFTIKTGDVCTDMRALETFITNEREDLSDEPVASVEVLISEGGALDVSLPCDDQVEAAAAMCQRLTRVTPGPAPLVTDYVPCCSAATVLNMSRCLCEDEDGDGSRLAVRPERETFLTRLIGFAPLGCGFSLTESCPAVNEQLSLPPPLAIVTEVEGIPATLPIAYTNATTWEILWRDVATPIGEVEYDQTLVTVPVGTEQLWFYVTCDEYLDDAAEICGDVRHGVNVSTYDVTRCCAFLKAAHDRGCFCEGADGLDCLGEINPDLFSVAPAACSLRLDAPPALGEAICDADDVEAVTELELQRASGGRGGLIYATTDDTGLGEIVPSSTASCLLSVVIAEASCIPLLESIVEPFELDLGWRACCSRIEAVNDNLCFCDGAVEAAMNVTARRDIHRRVLSAVPGACQVDLTIGDQCPSARFDAAIATEEDVVTAVDVTTYGTVPNSTIEVDAEVYDVNDAVSTVTASGAVVISNFSGFDESGNFIPSASLIPTAVLTLPELANDTASAAGVVMDGDGVVTYEIGALPGVILTVDGGEVGVTVLSPTGGVTRVHANATDGEEEEPDAEITLHGDEGALEASVGDATASTPLSSRDEGIAAFVEALQNIDASFDDEAGVFTFTLPDGTVVTVDASTFLDTIASVDSLAPAPAPTIAPIVDSPAPAPATAPGPSTAVATIPNGLSNFGVVVRDGEVVPGDSLGGGVCDAVRGVKSFLTTSLDPGMTSYFVMGAVSCCENRVLDIPELTIPIRYRPRGSPTRTYAPPLTSPTVECLGLNIVGRLGNIREEIPCERFSYDVVDYGVLVRVTPVSLCQECSLVGRGTDGALFKLTHPARDTLTAMQPQVMRLRCDLDHVLRPTPRDGGGGERRKLLELPTPRLPRPPHARGLKQFLGVRQHSNPGEVSDFWQNLEDRVRGGEDDDEGAVFDDGGGGGSGNRFDDYEPPTTPEESRFALVGEDGAPATGGGGGGAAADADDDADAAPTATPNLPGDSAALPSSTQSASDVARCFDDVLKLANNVQWWSRGAGPLEPGLPNEPYDEYVFAGSIESTSDSADVNLDGIVLPIVFSPWVLPPADGSWRAVLDPASELEIGCSGVAIASPDGESFPVDADGGCGGVKFALSTYSPPNRDQGEGQNAAATQASSPPSVLLLEVLFDGVLCPGCEIVGAGVQGEMFRVTHREGASLDFVGPTVGALECAPGGAVGDVVDAAEAVPETLSAGPGATAGDGAARAVIAQGDDRDTSSCLGRQGLNLKGELLNDGNALIKGEAEDCCEDCKANDACNVWVYCEGDCVEYAYHSCWLKRTAAGFDMQEPDAWAASEDTPWTSGWFPPKEGATVPEPAETPAPAPAPAPAPVAAEPTRAPTIPFPSPDETADTVAAAPEEPTPPDIRVVPVGGEEAPPPPPAPTPAEPIATPPTTTTQTTPAENRSFVLVPGEPTQIPASTITITPNGELLVNTSAPGAARVQPPASSSSSSSSSFPGVDARAAAPTCEDADVAGCPSPAGASDPLAAARVRGSFQLLRARDVETGGARDTNAGSLTLLRPGDEVFEVFVTGTLINANDEGVCLAGLEIPFAFPTSVVPSPGAAPIDAPAEDFVATCYYVGVRSREASAAPGTASARRGAFLDDLEPGTAPRACDETIALRTTADGADVAFEDDVALCPGCWLVGGRDGVLFSWKHKDGLAMSVRAGERLGFERARCAAVE